MSKPYYPYLMKPLRIRDKILKNRMAFSRAVPIFICGTNDVRPIDTMADFAGDIARNGASVVACPSGKFPSPFERSAEFAQIHHSAADPEGEEAEDGFRAPEPGEMAGFDLTLDEVKIKYARTVEQIHDEGSLACISMMDIEPFGWTCDELSTEQIEMMIDQFVAAAKAYAGLGFDVLCFYMSAGMSILGMSLSPVFNTRTDRFGGKTMTERAEMSFEIFRRVRKACPNVLIEAQVYQEDSVPGGYTFEDLKEYLTAARGLVDILQLRPNNAGATYLDSVREAEPVVLRYAAELKKLNTGIAIAPVTGFWKPEKNNEYIRDGKCDFIYMAKVFLSNPDYGQLVKEGRNDDIMPCLRCNKCHSSPGDPDGGCAVNPQLWLSVSNREHSRVLPAREPKKVAVVGGGPAGMEAAIIAARRGHNVTLYEQAEVLGGQLIHSEYMAFKWSVKEFKDFMAKQLLKSGVRVLLHTKATPEMLESEHYDAIIMATGAVCKRPKISGSDGKNVWLPSEVYGREKELGASVIIVGGSETGCEFGLYLSRMGIQCTVLTRKNRLAGDAQLIHYREFLMADCRKEPCFHYITHATTSAVTEDGVCYRDQQGNEHQLKADSVILSCGVEPVLDYMEDFAALTDEIYYVGDCRRPKDIRRAMKDGFNAGIRV